MNEVLAPVVIVTSIGLISGFILAAASRIFHVPVNEKAEVIYSILPGANCAACGYVGCEEYAKAISEGTAKANLCTPGGVDTASKIAEIAGVNYEPIVSKKAYVKCNGNRSEERIKYKYNGVNTCHGVSMFYGGKDHCTYGCIGYGDCVTSCPFGAISIKNDIAFVDSEKCTGCGLCVGCCPKNLIELRSKDNKARLLCNNKDKGGITRKICSEGCIGCRICERNCAANAIKVIENMAIIDEDKCDGCGKCIEVCPQNVLAF